MLEVILLAIVGIVTLLYIYLWHKYSYWTRRGVVQPPTLPFVGNLLDVVLMRTNSGQIYHKIYCKYYKTHDAVGIYGFMTPKLLLINPELIKQVMVTEFSSFHDNEFYVTQRLDPLLYMDPFCLRGEEWKPVRNSLASLLSSNKVKDMFPYMKQPILQLNAYLDSNIGKDIEAKELASLFTMDNVSNSAFGITSNCFTDPDAEFRKMGDILMKEQLSLWWQTFILFYFQGIRDILGYKFIPTKVSNFIESMVKQIVEYRKKNNIQRNDLIQNSINKNRTFYGISEEVIHGATLFMEGFETSSIVICYTLYELAMNMNIQQKLYEEIKKAKNDLSELDYDKLINLRYLDNVIQESLRKYGVLYNYARICTKGSSFFVDGKSVEIEPNTPVIIPAYSLHHDSQYYPDPDVFDPDRFTDFNKESRQPYTFIPFGEGPRICPGIRFADTQVKLCISNIVSKYRIISTEKTPKQVIFSSSALLLLPNQPLLIQFEKRT